MLLNKQEISGSPPVQIGADMFPQADPLGQPERSSAGRCEKRIPLKEGEIKCCASFLWLPSPRSPLARPRSLRRLLRPGGTVAGIVAGVAAVGVGAGAARAFTAPTGATTAAGVGLRPRGV